MSQFLLLTALLLGLALAVRRAIAYAAVADGLNWWIINVALPATVLELVPTLRFSSDLWFLIASQWLLAALTALLVAALGARWGWTRGRIGAISLLTAFNNTAFLGYPMVEALRGRAALTLAVIADQLGCFIALAVGGAILVSVYSGDRPDPRIVARRAVLFPPFLALLGGLLVGAAGGWPQFVTPVLHRLGQTLAPLALFSVGLRLSVHVKREQRAATAFAVGWKLALMPLAAWLMGRSLGVHGPIFTVGVLENAAAPMFTAVILARQHDLDPALADTVLSVAMILSFITVPAWSLLLP